MKSTSRPPEQGAKLGPRDRIAAERLLRYKTPELPVGPFSRLAFARAIPNPSIDVTAFGTFRRHAWTSTKRNRPTPSARSGPRLGCGPGTSQRSAAQAPPNRPMPNRLSQLVRKPPIPRGGSRFGVRCSAPLSRFVPNVSGRWRSGATTDLLSFVLASLDPGRRSPRERDPRGPRRAGLPAPGHRGAKRCRGLPSKSLPLRALCTTIAQFLVFPARDSETAECNMLRKRLLWPVLHSMFDVWRSVFDVRSLWLRPTASLRDSWLSPFSVDAPPLPKQGGPAWTTATDLLRRAPWRSGGLHDASQTLRSEGQGQRGAAIADLGDEWAVVPDVAVGGALLVRDGENRAAHGRVTGVVYGP